MTHLLADQAPDDHVFILNAHQADNDPDERLGVPDGTVVYLVGELAVDPALDEAYLEVEDADGNSAVCHPWELAPATRYRVVERQIVGYTWEVWAADSDAAERSAEDGVPDSAWSKLWDATTEAEMIGVSADPPPAVTR